MTNNPSESATSGGSMPTRNPWLWVPTLYFAQGLPNVVVMTVAVIMYKGLGLSNTDIALYTSWLYLPWVIKPLWSPVVDILKTRRSWIWAMQLIVGAGLAGVALTIPTAHFFQYTLAFLWLLAFSSATHDIAADGFYMLATSEKEQAFFVGIRSTFFRLSMISGQGLLVIVAGLIQSHTGLPPLELRATATPGTALLRVIDPPASLPAEATNGPMRLIATPAVFELAPEPRARTEVASLISFAKRWNSEHGFNPIVEKSAAAKAQTSWWKNYVSGPLSDFLRSHFGRKAVAAGKHAGNVAVNYLKLTQAPEKEIIVTVSFDSGNKSISIAEGARLVFTPQNWSSPAVVVVQADAKLNQPAITLFKVRSGNIRLSWVVVFLILGGLFLLFALYHRFILPRPARDRRGEVATVVAFLQEFLRTFGAFFAKDRVGVLLLFLLFYRFAEAQLVKLVTPFLLDARDTGGLGLTTGQVGFVYGTVGIIALTCGGIAGGMIVARYGLKRCLWPMVLIMHLPDAVFVYLAYVQPDNFVLINACVALEQFGYGFGFAAYMLYMIYIARGAHETAHYAICTGFMALGMMLPGMFSGWLQDVIGYQHFFVWVMLATIPGFVVAALVPLEADFGKKG